MLNMLIADDNIDFVKLIINSILITNDKIRLIKVATDGRETLDIIKKQKIDILLLDLNMPIYSGLDIINEISTIETSGIPDIIAISGDTKMLPQLIKSKKVDYFFSKNTFNLIERLNDALTEIVVNNNTINIKQFILSELQFLGFSLKLNGTKYILESILYIYNSNNYDLIENLEKNVYPVLAKKHNTTVMNIKSNILKSINSMYITADIEKNKKYFYFDYDIKPTPKLLIEIILNKLMEL